VAFGLSIMSMRVKMT